MKFLHAQLSITWTTLFYHHTSTPTLHRKFIKYIAHLSLCSYGCNERRFNNYQDNKKNFYKQLVLQFAFNHFTLPLLSSITPSNFRSFINVVPFSTISSSIEISFRLHTNNKLSLFSSNAFLKSLQ